MKILFTGDYLPDYNRTRIIRKGLIELGHNVIDFPFTKKNSETREKLIAHAESCSFIFMPSFTHKEVPWVKKNLPNKKIIFDPLISRHMTRIYDYKLAWPYSFSALRNFLRDKHSMQAADSVVTDTEAHRQYFHKKFSIPLEKMSTLYIGNDFDMYRPLPRAQTHEGYLVGFYGGFIPLQGVMSILGAIDILKNQSDIHFELTGSGFEFAKAQKFVSSKNLSNVTLPGWLDEERLAQRICDYDVCLGIFGDTLKSDLVIPNKVYHYAACAKPIISKKSPAISELFTHKENIYLCETNPQAIADAVMWMKANQDSATKMGEKAHNMLKQNHTARHIADKIVLLSK